MIVALITVEVAMPYPTLDQAALSVGIFGSACKLDTPLKTGDRVRSKSVV